MAIIELNLNATSDLHAEILDPKVRNVFYESPDILLYLTFSFLRASGYEWTFAPVWHGDSLFRIHAKEI